MFISHYNPTRIQLTTSSLIRNIRKMHKNKINAASKCNFPALWNCDVIIKSHPETEKKNEVF